MENHTAPGVTSDIAHARISTNGLLESSDGPLLDLQLRAGAKLGEPLVLPALASIARLATRLNVVISRAVTIADGVDDINVWVHARPRGNEIEMTLSRWERHPAQSRFNDQPLVRDADFLRSTADWTFEVDADLRITRIAPLEPKPDCPDFSEYTGRKLPALVELVADSDGDMPILIGLARGRGFEGQVGRLRPQGDMQVRIDAVAVVDTAGVVTALQGTMSIASEKLATEFEPEIGEATTSAAESSDETTKLFGHRLERVLRLPLDRIIANAESINAQQEGPIRRDYVHYAADIANAGRHMLALVEDLAELQAVESPDFQPMRDALDLADLARKAAALLAVRAHEKSIRIDRPMDGDALPAIGDYRRVLQILVNLVGNAVRYSPDGSMIWIRTEDEGDSSSVIVADQGRGIDPVDHERIFERFERLNANEPGGSGLGLYISRRLARAMGGDITVDSASGQGARFTLTLPKA